MTSLSQQGSQEGKQEGGQVDGRAIVDPSARLGKNVTIGPWSLIGPDVELGDNVEIASHVVVRGPSKIGNNVKIYQFATVGEDTPAFAYEGEETLLEVGDGTVIREGVTIHRGMVKGGIGRTAVGRNCLLMAYVHIGHDCLVGDHVIMANNASLAGHVTVGDHANFGGYSGIPQFRAIGAYTHIAAMSLVLKDVPAYMTVSGNPAVAVGLNLEGMKRRGYSKETMQAVRQAHRTVYRKSLSVKEALNEITDLRREHAEVELFAQSVENSEWGIIRGRASQRD
ncbi:MAG: acyl-ACP--UDP-N-acetylglucosamine O-acyltransferase [Pseudomonadota bacterium]